MSAVRRSSRPARGLLRTAAFLAAALVACGATFAAGAGCAALSSGHVSQAVAAGAISLAVFAAASAAQSAAETRAPASARAPLIGGPRTWLAFLVAAAFVPPLVAAVVAQPLAVLRPFNLGEQRAVLSAALVAALQAWSAGCAGALVRRRRRQVSDMR